MMKKEMTARVFFLCFESEAVEEEKVLPIRLRESDDEEGVLSVSPEIVEPEEESYQELGSQSFVDFVATVTDLLGWNVEALLEVRLDSVDQTARVASAVGSGDFVVVDEVVVGAVVVLGVRIPFLP